MEAQQTEATRAAIKQLQADFNSHAESAAGEIRRLHARVEELEKDLGNAKRLVSKIWGQHPEARDTIEKATGAWLVFGQDVETDGVSAQRVTQAEAQQPTTGEPVLIVEKEPDYWASGHFYEGNKPHINPTKVWHLPIGTKLYTHPAPSVLDDVVRDAERVDALYTALEVCSAELFAQCAHQGRAMKYVEQARKALAAEQCARAALMYDIAHKPASADALDAARYRYLRDVDWRYSGELEAVIRLQANALWDVKIDEAIAAQTRSQGDSA